ncbi:unnamed protein product [Urochloa humidicola]
MSNQTTNRRCRRRRSPPLDYGDLLREVLLRVPPHPSTLPRISLVCKRWRRVISDQWFLRRFRAYHGMAPLLGFFEHRVCLIFHDSNHDHGKKDFVFNPILWLWCPNREPVIVVPWPASTHRRPACGEISSGNGMIVHVGLLSSLIQAALLAMPFTGELLLEARRMWMTTCLSPVAYLSLICAGRG